MDQDLAARAADRLHVPLVMIAPREDTPWLGNPSVKFCACIPLRTGQHLCVGDFIPRVLSESELLALNELALA